MSYNALFEETRSLYEILGVAKDAGAAEIKVRTPPPRPPPRPAPPRRALGDIPAAWAQSRTAGARTAPIRGRNRTERRPCVSTPTRTRAQRRRTRYGG